MIPYGRQDIVQEDIDAVIEVLTSDFLTQGPKVPLFENRVAHLCDAKHAVAVNSATSALHIACMALDIGSGDLLWTSPITFVASANCGLYCGAEVDFVDIDPQTYNLCPIELEKKLLIAKKNGRLPKVVVAVHLCGQSCDMEAIYRLSETFGFKIIEDASHAIGGKYLDQYIGNCRFSDITVFSFHPVKIITTAEGGLALTNNSELAQKMGLYRSHGITRDPELMIGTTDGPWYYQQLTLGYNYRMTDLQAALGISQLNRLNEFVERRQELASRYDSLLGHLPLDSPYQLENTYSSFHLYVIRLQLDKLPMSHVEVFKQLRANDIGVNLHYIPVHTHPYYEYKGFKPQDFPEAINYYKEAISLPLYQGLTFEQQDRVVAKIESVLRP